jgi:hypothetical protein
MTLLEDALNFAPIISIVGLIHFSWGVIDDSGSNPLRSESLHRILEQSK